VTPRAGLQFSGHSPWPDCNLPAHPRVQQAETDTRKETAMLGWILTFLVIALIAGALGFGGVAGASAGIAQILFYIFIVLLLISLVMHFVRGAAR
jgi:uncharacterized membrane protein YtjA (UPF0391 family)